MRVGMIRVSREVSFIAGICRADTLDNLVEKGQVSKGVLKEVKVVLLTRCIYCYEKVLNLTIQEAGNV